jgi:hypothetical protein
MEGEFSVPDYDAEYRIPMYKGQYNDLITKFIVEYEKRIIKLKKDKLSNIRLSRDEKKLLKKELKELLAEFKPVFQTLKRKNMGLTHFKNTYFESPELLEATKKELEKLKGKLVNLEHISQNELLANLPRVNKKLKVLIPLNDNMKIKGEYFIAGKIRVASLNSFKDKTYKSQIIENRGHVNDYNIYTYFKSVDGSGVDFYNTNIDINDEYAVNRAEKVLTAKEKIIVEKMKAYKTQMKSLINDMAKFRTNLPVARKATIKGQKLQKQINTLYGNDDDKYYDFMQILDIDTKEMMIEFNQVLRGSVLLFGI